MAHWSVPLVDLARFHEVDVRGVAWDREHPLANEAMVRLSRTELAHESFFARRDGGNAPFHRPIPGSRNEIWLRRTVVDKLLAADAWLRPQGVRLLVITGHTTPACLAGLWEFYLAEARRRLPEGTKAQWYADACTHVRDPIYFDPKDARTWPAHSSGGAVDVLLQDVESGALLDMGSNFEELTEVSAADYFERLCAQGLVAPDDTRLLARRLLHEAMSREGFLNEPPLYWHFDWGNQLYVKTHRVRYGTAPDAAWYGYAMAPEEA